jgi:transposase/transposase IS116/IS110/IS902 family protein
MFVGWDWASTTHDVTGLDEAGVVVDRWAFRHTEQDLVAALDRLARLAEPAALPVIIERTSGLVVDRLVAAGHPVVPVHPPRFGLRVRAGARRGPSPTPATATSWPTTCAPMGTGCAGWAHPTWASKNCRPWCGCPRTTCAPGPRLATSSAPCSRRTGPAPTRCSSGWRRRSRSPSWPTTRPPRPPPGSARPAWPASAAGPATAAASPSSTAGPAALGPHRPGRHPAGHPGDPCRCPGPAATHPAWDHRRTRGSDRHPRRLPPTRQAAGRAARGRHHQPGPAAGRGRADPGPGPSPEQAAAECGAAPVTKASGKTSGVYFRWAANRRARKALTAFAHNARMQSPWAGRLYARAHARGKRNPHATRIVARAWLRVIWACWQQPTPTTPPCTPPRFELQPSQLDSGD